MVTSKLTIDLLTYLNGQNPNNTGLNIQAIKRLKSGWAGDIYSFHLLSTDRAIDRNLILKIYSATETGIYSIERESKALKVLRREGLPVPQLFYSDTSLKYLGRPFIIMESIQGNLMWDEYTAADESRKTVLEKTFAGLLFHLHSIDVKSIAPNFKTEDTSLLIKREMKEIKKIIDTLKLHEYNDLYKWLASNEKNVQHLKPAILHRDYHPWNVIKNTDNSFYVIDWVWGIGDYRFDLAWTVSLMERSGFKQFATKTFDAYSELFKGDIENFEYFKVLATLRWLLNVTSSIKSGTNLREGTKEEFESFLKVPTKNALDMIKDITDISVTL